jgi:hypothetical protein
MMAEGNQFDWRTLCAAAATEPDSEKLAGLVEEIIKALDKVEADAHRPARLATREARVAASRSSRLLTCSPRLDPSEPG